jgi:hypothetical protein
MSEQVILFQDEGGGVGVIFPTEDLSIEDVARKDTPSGRPYLIVDRVSLPDAWEFQSAWTVDFSKPDGVGLGHDVWFAQWIDPAKVQAEAETENAAIDMYDEMYAVAEQENRQFDALQELKAAS